MPVQNAAEVPEFSQDYLVVKRLTSWLVLHLLCCARDHAKGFALCPTQCPVGACCVLASAVGQVRGCACAWRAGCGRGARGEGAALQRRRAKCVGFIATGGGGLAAALWPVLWGRVGFKSCDQCAQ